jgi:uncharacterized membrane protein YphA (DoxX/SURF4 family)
VKLRRKGNLIIDLAFGDDQVKKKSNVQKSLEVLRILLGAIFILAAVYRIFNYEAGFRELANINIAGFFVIPIILLELFVGISLVAGKLVKFASLTGAIFLSVAIIIAFVTNGYSILSNIGELFVFNPTPTDIFLHIIYLALLISIFMRERK